MKTIAKYIILVGILCLLALSTFCSCNLSHGFDDTSYETTTPVSEVLGDVELFDYKIIYAELATAEERDAATLLRNAVRAVFGKTLMVGTDWVSDVYSDRAEYEIIVGKTNIPEANEVYETLGRGEYTIAVKGSKIILVGYTPTETMYAVERFLATALGYDVNTDEIPNLSSSVIQLVSEKGIYRKYMDKISSDPLVPKQDIRMAIGQYKLTSTELIFNRTAEATLKAKTGDGSYLVQFSVEKSKKGGAIHLLCNRNAGQNVRQVNMKITDNFVDCYRGDNSRGGVAFEGDATKYTFRLEVHPSASLVRYYVNGIFLGEMNASEQETALIEDSTVAIAYIGEDMNVVIYDIYMEKIEDVEPRRYDALEIELENEDIYPKPENEPAQTIYLLSYNGMSNTDVMTATSLQGIVNRTTPEIFFDYRSYNGDGRYENLATGEAYLEMLRKKGYTIVSATLEELLIRFKDRYNGVIVGDCFETNYSENVTTSLCGALDAVYMTEAKYKIVYQNAEKEILYNLKDMDFDSAVDAYRWVWDQYGECFSKTVLYHLSPIADCGHHWTLACRDYAVMTKAFVFRTDDVKTLEDYDFYMSIFASTAPNTGIFGQGGGCFPEFEMFNICGQFGKYFTYSFSTPNMSLLSAVPVDELKQKRPEQMAELAEDTVYVTYDLSEGDNLSWDYHLWNYNFRDEAARASVAKGYSICGALYYLAPCVLEYLYDEATPNDYFFLDGGGISNLGSPDNFGLLYNASDRAKIVERMLELTNYVAQKTDISVLRVLYDMSDEMIMRYNSECPAIQAVFLSYGNLAEAYGGTSQYSQSNYLVGEIVRCRCYISSFLIDSVTLGQQLNRAIKDAGETSGGIVFARIFIFSGQILEDIGVLDTYREELEAATNKKVVIVRPDEYARLYREYMEWAEN